ncbi:hypothetical protein FACS189473_2250 [Spirochaetia bacterium]|nr:hypothetical protein FACS189473_2250 [Spirochaetia bacterium]
MKPQIKINVMILGQTGVGKSSLINYLYGSEKVTTGTGKPVTGRGDFQKVIVPSPLKPDTNICILDSWGLESNRAEDWKNVINEKLSGSLSFDDMVYGIVYCMSYASGRIQDFEIAMLKELLAKQYKVIIALTNADSGNYEEYKTVYRDKLTRELPEFHDVYTVVDVCAQAKPKLGQSSADAKTFGKEELFVQLEKDAGQNFVKVILAHWTDWRDESIKSMRTFRLSQSKKINEFKGKFLELPDDKEMRFFSEMRSEAQGITDQIFAKVKNGLEDAKELYQHLYGAFARTSALRALSTITGLPLSSFFMQMDSTLGKNEFQRLQDHFFAGIFTGKSLLKNEIIEKLEYLVNAVENEIQKFYGKAEKMLWEIERA